MRRTCYGLISLTMFCILFAGCASFKPVDLNPRINSGQLVQKTDNFVVLFDKSASMSLLHILRPLNVDLDEKPSFETTRLMHAKVVTKNMIATFPEIKLNAGLRTFWSEDSTVLIYGMKPLVKDEYTKAVDSVEFATGRTPMGKAITEAGKDLKPAAGNSAIIIVSDFSETAEIDDIRPEAVMAAITKVNADYGNRLCVYAIQVGYTPDGKELSERIVQNVAGGYNINADRLVKPAAMAAFVEKVISGNCDRYQELAAKPREKIVITPDEPIVMEKIAGAEPKIVVLAFEDVHFDFDKSTLKPEARAILKRDIQLLKDNPNAKIRIAGYTSASGTVEYNQKLSERRAASVQRYLISEGLITPDRLDTIGYGETNPAMYEAAPKELYSKAAKANMRVLFEIIVQ
jgi:outer membrane protein OmpA-like peptidoglycan-associated protein